jgi:2-keto-myo-inositol isomerase
MGPEVQLCLSTAHSTGTSLEEDIRIASEAGFTCLDAWAPKLEAYHAAYPVAWLDARMRERKVYLAAVSGLELLPPYPAGSALMGIDGDYADDYAVLQAHFLELCSWLDALGGGIVVMRPGLLPAGAIGEKAVTAGLVRELQDLAALAAPFEVQIAFEFRGRAGSPVRTLEGSRDLIRLVAQHNVGLALSTVDLSLGGSRPDRIEPLGTSQLKLVHLGDVAGLSLKGSQDEERVLPGQGVVPLPEICKHLAAQGFRGPYSVEPPAGQPAESAALARQAASDMLTTL